MMWGYASTKRLRTLGMYCSMYGMVCIAVNIWLLVSTSNTLFIFIFFFNTVRLIGGSTLSSCAVTCSSMRASTADSCNIYFVESGICKAGILDYPKTYSKPFGSSASLVSVNVVNTTTSGSLGLKVKPGKFVSQMSSTFLTVTCK